MIFSHSGAIGDIVYHLPVIRELGGGDLYILPQGRDGYRSPEDMQFSSLRRLLERQPYISKVAWSGTPVGVCFDAWRARLDFNLNLTDQASQWLGMGHISTRVGAWIEGVSPARRAKVVFVRSQRANHPHFPWRTLVGKYGKDAVFVGLPEEHAEFCAHFGHVPHAPTLDLLDAAEIIAGCDLYIGNSTGLTAVAEGLKKRCIISSIPCIMNCVHFGRPDAQHCYDKVEVMWDV